MNWLWQIAAKKAVAKIVQIGLAFLAQEGTQKALGAVGVNVTVDPVLATAAVFGALEFVRNWLKVKVGLKGI